MLITKPLHEYEATYEITNTLKEYRDKYKLFIYKTPIQKIHGNLEINRELSSTDSKRGHRILTPSEQERNDTMNFYRSVRRSRTHIADLIEMNDFKYFGTLTTSPEKVDRYDDSQVKRKITKSLANMQRIFRFEYLLIPERHKDGALHFHALFTELPEKWLRTSRRLVDKKGRPLFNLLPYRLGFSEISRVGNLQATANYCAKYVTKALDESDKGKKRYWHSNGLKKPHKHENVDPTPYVNHPEAESWPHDHYTGYQVPKQV
jgi:hypothetical protein